MLILLAIIRLAKAMREKNIHKIKEQQLCTFCMKRVICYIHMSRNVFINAQQNIRKTAGKKTMGKNAR